MRHLRANAVAYLALFVALGSTGALAAGKISGQRIKVNSEPGNRLKADSVTGKQVRESSLGSVPAAQNAQSAASSENAGTLDGHDSTAFGAGVFTGHVTGSFGTGSSTETSYGAPTGSSDKSLSEPPVTQLSPNASIVARDLAVKSNTLGAALHPIVYTLMDDGSPAISCTIDTDNFPSTCNSGANTATILPGSELSLRIEVIANPTSASSNDVLFGWRATTP